MKALSILQPWAWLIVHADDYPDPKRVENRTWRTSHRGPLLIHAGKRFDLDGYNYILQMRPDLAHVMPPLGRFPTGGIVGQVNVTDCVVIRRGDIWFNGPYGFVMADAKLLPFKAIRGQLAIFEAGN